jgi:hypothetical protein
VIRILAADDVQVAQVRIEINDETGDTVTLRLEVR